MAEYDLADGQRPLAGVVLCCTSLPQDVRTKVSASAEEMGATHKLDLTSDVTHLIVGNIATPKYRYVAKERPDIKVLHPDFIEAVRELWMASEELDLEKLETAHKLPSFCGLHICITGFSDPEQREAMSFKIEQEGAVYHGDLTKAVTHLIAAAPEGHKYNAARTWGLKIVSERWYNETLGRGMALDEGLYDPLVPIDEQGKDAFRLPSKTRTSLGKHSREGEKDNAAGLSRKKLRRSKSSRLESQSQDMWQDISAHSVDRDTSQVDQWTDRDERSTTAAAKQVAEPKRESSRSASVSADVAPGLFSGICILLRGFELPREKRLRQFLEPNGAHLVQNANQLIDAACDESLRKFHLLVPHSVVESTQLDVPVPVTVTSEWWVERCLHYKRLFDPDQDPLSKPILLGKQLSLDQMAIATTGFAGVELRQVAEAVKLLGATYEETITTSCAVLICGSKQVRKEKAFYARRHRIPVVKADWLWACLTNGKKASYDDFGIDLSGLDLADLGDTSAGATPLPTDPQRPSTNDAMKRKDEQRLKRLSTTRTKHATPSLSLQTTGQDPPKVKTKPQPIVHEDDDDEAPILRGLLLERPTESSQRTSQPLQELSPNRSPRKIIIDSEILRGEYGRVKGDTASPIKTALSSCTGIGTNVDEPATTRARPELDADISDLFKSASSRPSSATGMRSLQTRKKRPLGRAPSGISNRSTSISNHSDRPSTVLPSDESFDPAIEGFAPPPAVVPPSTQLGYETPEAEAHRLELAKALGKDFEDEEGFKRIASVGTVKDAATNFDTGVGNRVKGRHRHK